MNEIGRERSAHGEMRCAYKILFGKPDDTTQRRRRRENTIKMNLRETEFRMWTRFI